MHLLPFLFLLASPCRAPQDEPIRLNLARQAFREAEEAALADGGALWGRELVGPMLFADPATRAVVANQPDEREKLREQDGVFVGTLPGEVGIANTATDFAGVRWTMVVWPLPENRYARVQLLLHECFHRIQPELKHGGGDALNEHVDKEAGRLFLRLEYRALAEALVRGGEERKRALGDALLFRAQRRALFPEAAAKESSFERNEGLAEYTGLKLCGLPAAVLADRAAVRLERDESKPSFVRSFAYATGPAYGVLLDELGADWRRTVEPKTDLSALAATACGWKPPAELAREAQAHAERYDGERLAAAEHARARERAAADAKNRARFVDGPVLVLPLGGKMNYSFDPNDITPLEPQGSVYGTLYLVDDWGVLDVTAGGALIVRGASGGMQDARVPAPKDAAARPAAGEGWTLTLNEGWTLEPGARAGDWKIARAK